MTYERMWAKKCSWKRLFLHVLSSVSFLPFSFLVFSAWRDSYLVFLEFITAENKPSLWFEIAFASGTDFDIIGACKFTQENTTTSTRPAVLLFFFLRGCGTPKNYGFYYGTATSAVCFPVRCKNFEKKGGHVSEKQDWDLVADPPTFKRF